MSVPFIGLTGGIGAGKSTALRVLEQLGAATLSTDAVVHDLYGLREVRDAVLERFGAAVARDGQVDRSAVASRAFATREDREWLESLLWPRVGQRVQEWREALGRAGDPPRAAVVEVPLLFEAGLERGFDATIAVVAPEELRSQRAAVRGHASLQERGARQLSQQDKARRATYVVINDGTVRALESKLSAILDILET